MNQTRVTRIWPPLVHSGSDFCIYAHPQQAHASALDATILWLIADMRPGQTNASTTRLPQQWRGGETAVGRKRCIERESVPARNLNGNLREPGTLRMIPVKENAIRAGDLYVIDRARNYSIGRLARTSGAGKVDASWAPHTLTHSHPCMLSIVISCASSKAVAGLDLHMASHCKPLSWTRKQKPRIANADGLLSSPACNCVYRGGVVSLVCPWSVEPQVQPTLPSVLARVRY